MDFKITNALEDLKQGVNLPLAGKIIMEACDALVDSGLWEAAANTLVTAYDLIPFGWLGDTIKEEIASKAKDIVKDKIAETDTAKAIVEKVKSLNPFASDDKPKKPEAPKAPAPVTAAKETPKAPTPPVVETKPAPTKPAAAAPPPVVAPTAEKPAAKAAPAPLNISPPAPASAYKKQPSGPTLEEVRMAIMKEDRQVKISCPSLEGTRFELLFRSMEATETLSGLFEYNVELLCTNPNVPMEKVLGFDLTLSLELPLPVTTPPKRRYFNGYVSAFHFIGLEGEFAVFGATLRPRMWLLTRNQDCRIWEGKSVPEVVGSIFQEYGFLYDDKTFLTADRGEGYKPREYCVQYNETDFAFVSRLLEEEGIHYFFVHEEGKHTVFLADSIMGHVPTDGYGTIPFALADRRTDRDVEAVTSWSVHQTVEADHFAVGDFDFTDPRHEKVSSRATSQADRKHPRAGHFERYQYPEPIVKMIGYGSQMGESLAKVRAQEMHSQWEIIEAKCNARGLVVGGTFGLSDHPRDDFNKPAFLVTGAVFNLHSGDYQSTGDAKSQLTYTCNLWAINSQNPFRPQRRTPKPVISGPQTGIVVGSGGTPIHTDKFGRVQVAFPWMRPDTKGHASVSCWVRVSQIWAGAGWGSMHLPHVGHEVIVSFLDGDPDRPIVTGRVYNGQNNPWQKLGDHATRSYIRDQVGNRIVMQSKEEEKGISIHTPSLDTHLWLGLKDGIELPDNRDDFQKSAAQFVSDYFGATILPAPETRGGLQAKTEGDVILNASGNIYNVAKGTRIDITNGESIKIEDNSSFEITKGSKKSFNLGTELKMNAGASLEMTASAKAAFAVGLSIEVNYAAKLEVSRTAAMKYSKEKTHNLCREEATAAAKEIRHQVYAIPDILGGKPPSKFFGSALEIVAVAKSAFKTKSPPPGEAKAETIINAEQVLVRCGKSSILLKKNGTVEIEAAETIQVKAKKTVTHVTKHNVKAKSSDFTGGKVSLSGNFEVKE